MKDTGRKTDWPTRKFLAFIFAIVVFIGLLIYWSHYRETQRIRQIKAWCAEEAQKRAGINVEKVGDYATISNLDFKSLYDQCLKVQGF